MSQASNSKSFNAAIVSDILTESRVTTDAYVSDEGVSVVWSPATNIAFLLKFYPIFMYHMM